MGIEFVVLTDIPCQHHNMRKGTLIDNSSNKKSLYFRILSRQPRFLEIENVRTGSVDTRSSGQPFYSAMSFK